MNSGEPKRSENGRGSEFDIQGERESLSYVYYKPGGGNKWLIGKMAEKCECSRDTVMAAATEAAEGSKNPVSKGKEEGLCN